VPIQRFRAVLGVLLLSTEGGDIDKIVAAERKAILRVFGVAALVTAILSLLLASTIANPLRRLSAAAVRVRRGVKNREEIPDFSDRQDEIGNLSVAVRDMTNALYARIEAIESFAADVSHELKNPLTSLRSAVETLPLARNEASRNRLMEVIQHDVKRLDRLITDISDASRLDAELAREDAGRVDLARFVSDLVSVSREASHHKKKVEIELKVAKPPQGVKGYFVQGHDLRLGQVITNLIENARSFVPDEHGRITISLARAGRYNIVTVDDNGPGIRAENIDRIFERFYTDRPSSEAFGQNSGLGLSISRQIVEAHGGTLTAENIPGTKPARSGARASSSPCRQRADASTEHPRHRPAARRPRPARHRAFRGGQDHAGAGADFALLRAGPVLPSGRRRPALRGRPWRAAGLPGARHHRRPCRGARHRAAAAVPSSRPR